MKDKLIIFDTTLCDGEQSPGASMTRDEKQTRQGDDGKNSKGFHEVNAVGARGLGFQGRENHRGCARF